MASTARRCGAVYERPAVRHGLATRNKMYANLGQAYVACNQMQQAMNAFEAALADKTYFSAILQASITAVLPRLLP
ncbi:MAG: hypothetical protein ACLT98_08125 [Eggerthellaceae bacterium]